jgi:PhnB protein
MKLIPYLMYTKGQCREAFQFYAQALRGEIVTVSTYGDMPGACEHIPQDKHSRVANVQLVSAAATLMGADNVMGGDAADSDEGRNDTTVNVQVDSIEEAERVFAALSAGGKIEMPIAESPWALRFGMFTDRFGKPWMVNCMKNA